MHTLNMYMFASCSEVMIEVEVWILTSSTNWKWVTKDMKFNSFLVHKRLACTCKVDPMMYAHLDWDTFSITTRGGPLGGRPCKNRAMVYKPRLQFTFFTRRFGLGLKALILSFFAQNLRNSSLPKRVFFVELVEALAHEVSHKNHFSTRRAKSH